jgi:hypothetical protein
MNFGVVIFAITVILYCCYWGWLIKRIDTETNRKIDEKNNEYNSKNYIRRHVG